MKPLARSPFLIASLALAVAGPAWAQGANTLAVSRLSDLSFGIVVAGSSVTIDPSGPTAGEFMINGPKRSLLTLRFSLPPELTGPATLPVTFSAAWNDTNLPTGATPFDPVSGAQVTIPNPKKVYVWIGGSLNVSAAQPAGDYAGTVTLSVVIN